jgi:1-acyl-sn-glycerol-3-phosphate acyltransferase
VAALDYWGRSAWRRHLAVGALNAVLIDREKGADDPLAPLRAALEAGESLILFPEGTRGDMAEPARFRAGLYNLAQEFAEANLVPVYLENLHRSLPKGKFVPIPMICTVRFGLPMNRIEGETREAFLERARRAVADLA